MKFFPFKKVRDEQSKLLDDVKKAISEKKNIVAHAPTGLGKTAAVLTPIVEYAMENDLNVFFLTSRNAQHQLIIETLSMMNKKFPIKAVDFVGKKHMCPKMRDYDSSTINFFEFCMDLRKNKNCDLYNNSYTKAEPSADAKKLVNEILSSGPQNIEDVIEITKDRFCTYEISLLLAKEAKIVVADYFHIFDPAIQKFLFNKTEKELSKTIIVIDEAHNLPDRIRNDWTLKLNTFLLKKASDKINKSNSDMSEKILDIANELQILSSEKLSEKSEILVKKENFVDLIEKTTGQSYEIFVEEFSDVLESIEERDESDELFKFSLFLKHWPGAENGFVRIFRKDKTQSGKSFPSIEYHCLDPSIISKPLIDEAYSTILMSGTLLPTEMYRDVLGLAPERTILKEYSNPFPRKNKLVLVSKDITTKYEERTEEMFRKIATSSAYIINSIDGNSAVFFPSYDLLSKSMFYLSSIVNKKLFVEKQGMSKREKEDLINNFKTSVISGGSALIGVQGANFSEGIDLPGELLKGVTIVGLPLPPPDLRQKALIDYFDAKFGRGWDYGYSFPAVNRALQAAGRCIRSETDTGIIAFLDKRFLWSKYKKIIPPDWNAEPTDDFRTRIKEFFENK